MSIYIFNEDIPEDVLTQAEKNIIKGYASRVSVMAEAAARELYLINNFSHSGDVKFQQWYEAASNFLRTRSGHSLIAAKYGYAVEEYVNLRIAVGIPSIPIGYRVRLQVTHGHTRPDIVILKEDGMEIAWLDITNESNWGHIQNKDGNWKDKRKFIAELLYPDFDASQIAFGSRSIASRSAASSIARQAAERERRLMRHMAQKMNLALCEFKERIRRSKFISRSVVAKCIERHFGVIFSNSYKHPIIKSMLMLYIGCSEANRLADARNCLNGLYGEVRQDKSAAMSYIEESCNILNPYTCY